MPYIGNASANRFVASKAATQFSGDGSTTAFTLDHSVGADEDILVSVDGVIQEPSVAYAVSGTTLTFTAAPSSNSGNNIFVYYLFRTVGTVDHPATSALSATSGTFSTSLDVTGDATFDTSTLKVDSTNNRVGIGTVSPDNLLHIKTTGSTPSIELEQDAGTSYKALIKLAGNDLEIRGSSGSLEFYNGSQDGDSSALVMKSDATGAITKPLQPAFHAHKNGTDQLDYALNSEVTVTLTHERFDQNGDFNTSNSTFTAPVTGKYFLNVMVRTDTMDTGASFYVLCIRTSNEDYRAIIDPNFSSDLSYFTERVSILADMDANDTAFIFITQNGGTQQADIDGNTEYTQFSGFLAC